jgi:hypothetical protein
MFNYNFLRTERRNGQHEPPNKEDWIFRVNGKVMVSKDMQLQLLLAKVEPILTHDPNQLKS